MRVVEERSRRPFGVKNEIEISHRSARPSERTTRDAATPEFVKGMTHELRTPLNVIIGLCQLLERDLDTPLSPDQRDSVDRMERNAQALLQTVNHLLVCIQSGSLG